MIELPKPVHPYGKITKRNADKFFADCMSVKDERIAFVKNLAISQGVQSDRLQFTRASIDAAWVGVHKLVKFINTPPDASEINNTPEWFTHLNKTVVSTHSQPLGRYDLLSLWIMDGLAYYFGEVFVSEFDHISWKSISADRYEMTCMPHIVSKEWMNFRFCPWQQTQTAMIGAWYEHSKFNPKFFSESFNGMIKLGQM